MTPIRDRQFTMPVAGDDIAQPPLRQLLADWLAACGDAGAPPSESFIDPFRLRYILDSVIVIEVVVDAAGGRRYRYRVVGTDLVAHTGRDLTRHWVDEHPERELSQLAIEASEAVVTARQPALMQFRRNFYGRYYPVAALVLPVGSGAGGMPTRLLVGQHYPADAPRSPFGAAPG